MNPMPSAVSVVMRSFNEAWAIRDTIRQLSAQDFGGEIELIVIDSGSSDGSEEIIRDAVEASNSFATRSGAEMMQLWPASMGR